MPQCRTFRPVDAAHCKSRFRFVHIPPDKEGALEILDEVDFCSFRSVILIRVDHRHKPDRVPRCPSKSSTGDDVQLHAVDLKKINWLPRMAHEAPLAGVVAQSEACFAIVITISLALLYALIGWICIEYFVSTSEGKRLPNPTSAVEAVVLVTR